MEGLLVVAVVEVAVVGDGLGPQNLEQVPHHFRYLEPMGKCTETPLECSKGTRLKQEPSLENGTGTGALTTSLTLCASPILEL